MMLKHGRTLGDIAIVEMGQSPLGSECNKNGAGLPLLNGPTEFGPKHPVPVQFTEYSRKVSETGDLLFCVRGSAGKMNWADQKYAIGRGLAAIRHRDNSKLQPLIRAVVERALPRLLAVATGSTFPNVSKADILSIPVPDMDAENEREISSLISMLDDKIELNRQMNETLEAQARALFRDWFVDFGPVKAKMAGDDPYLALDLWSLFPNRLDEDGVPEGWGWITIGAGFDLTMGQSPPGDTYNDDGEGLPFFQGRTDFGFRYPENRKYCDAPKRVAEAEDTLVSVRAPVGDINLAWEKSCVGRGVASLRHKSGSSSFTYYSAAALRSELEIYQHTGTVFGAINKKQFEALRTIDPNETVLKAFDQLVGPIDQKVRANELESRTLAQTRDLLLPKLLSGEIRVNTAEFIDEAA